MRHSLVMLLAPRPRFTAWLTDLTFTLCSAGIVASILGIGFLNSSNGPTGGDAASHLLYAWLYSNELLFSGQVLPVVPEVFGGSPFLSYYFPLPFIVIAVLSKFLGLASAFKWGSLLPAMLLPGAVFSCSRRWLGFSWYAALFAGLGTLAFLLHEQNSIWGGNLLSTLSGEFAYSYGLSFGVLAMMAWARAIYQGRGWLTAGLLEAASGFSHGFPLLIVGLSTAFLLLESAFRGHKPDTLRNIAKSAGLLLRGHLLAFALLGGWLWPMLEMHGLTIPNDAYFVTENWHDFLPTILIPFLASGVLGLLLLAIPGVRHGWAGQQRSAACYFIGASGLASVAFLAGDRLGLADIRFFPLTWLLGAIACGWLAGQAFAFLGNTSTAMQSTRLIRPLLVVAICFCMLGWIGQNVRQAPDWALWNHSGLDAKPQWNNLSKLFPLMQGDLWSPRIVFEHDPANNDLGSTRSLEALPMFLNHRPVLEGLYMESAVLGPAIYQLQSEVSTHPSSPLVRFPSGSLDPEFAARHMNFLHADTLLLRSPQAKAAIEANGLFVKVAESPPFALYHLKQFDSHLAQVVTLPLRMLPNKDWMQDAFSWFRTRSRFDAYLPVYGKNGGNDDKIVDRIDAAAALISPIREKLLSRNELIFETEAIGKPHLIKIGYNLRWQLESKGSMQIAGPGFMLVVPQEKEIHLVYGHTLIGKIGMIASVVAALCVLLLFWQRIMQPAAVPQPTEMVPASFRYWMPMFIAWALLAAIGAYLAIQSPERRYKQAWAAMDAHHYQEASENFLSAYQLRRPPAKREEALFWLAMSNELAGQRPEAEARYRELCDNYHGYWLPESLYRYIRLEMADGRVAETVFYLKRLREEFPNNQWSLQPDLPKS